MFEKYPTLKKVLSAVPRPRTGIVFDTLEKFKIIDAQQVYRKGKGKRVAYFVWDSLHGHWEVYDSRGRNTHSVLNTGERFQDFAPSDNRKVLNL